MPSRRFPHGCEDIRHKHDYNIFVTDYGRNIRLQEGTYQDLGYGWFDFHGGIKANV